MPDQKRQSFKEAGDASHANLLQETALLLRQNKKYWMIPVIIVLLVFGMLIALGGTSAAPFIYQMF